MILIPSAIVMAAGQYGVPASLALAVARQESGMNPAAVSPKGAIGIFQLMPATASSLGVDPHDPLQNIQGGVRYLAMLLSEFSDPVAAVAAYNWGPTAVASAIAQYGPTWLAHAPGETQGYVGKILGVGPDYQSLPDGLPAAAPATELSPTLPSPGTWAAPSGFGAVAAWAAVILGGALIWETAR